MSNPDESAVFGAIVLAAAPADVSPTDPDLYGLDRYGLPLHGWVLRAVRDAGIRHCIVLHDGCLASQSAQWMHRFPEVLLRDIRDLGPDAIPELIGIGSECVLVLDANRPALRSADIELLTIGCRGCMPTALAGIGLPSGGGASLSVDMEKADWAAACLDAASAQAALSRLMSRGASRLAVNSIVRNLLDDGTAVDPVPARESWKVGAVESLSDWVDVGDVLRDRIVRGHVSRSVVVTDPDQVWIDADVRIGPGTILLPGVHLTGRTQIGAGCRIGPHVVADDATIGTGCNVGPFAHLRRGAVLGDRVRIGNFVEVKNSVVGDGSAAGHLTYLGDAAVGAGSNIGAGTITCNYDGKSKHRTQIGDGAFVGSHSTLVAPVTIGDGAWTAAGSVITKDVPADALAVGRARQENRDGWAKARREARSGKESGS